MLFNTLRPRQNCRRFADDTFKRIFLNKNVTISIKISLKFVPKGPINNNPALVQIMAWRRSGDKPLSEPMMVSLLTHICVTRPQWVKAIYEKITVIPDVYKPTDMLTHFFRWLCHHCLMFVHSCSPFIQVLHTTVPDLKPQKIVMENSWKICFLYEYTENGMTLIWHRNGLCSICRYFKAWGFGIKLPVKYKQKKWPVCRASFRLLKKRLIGYV